MTWLWNTLRSFMKANSMTKSRRAATTLLVLRLLNSVAYHAWYVAPRLMAHVIYTRAECIVRHALCHRNVLAAKGMASLLETDNAQFASTNVCFAHLATNLWMKLRSSSGITPARIVPKPRQHCLFWILGCLSMTLFVTSLMCAKEIVHAITCFEVRLLQK